MFEGRCNIQVFNADRLGDEPFLKAMQEKRLTAFLRTLDVAQQAKTKNLLLDTFVAEMFYRTWSSMGIPSLPNYWFDGSLGAQATLATVLLMTTSSEPTLEEIGGDQYTDLHSLTGTVSTSYGGKRFIEDDAEAHQIYVNPDGRESIILLSRFLWLPSQGNLSDIRSVGCCWAGDGDSTGSTRRLRVARVRLKDDGGNPITMDKSSSQALLLEYEHEFVSA